MQYLGQGNANRNNQRKEEAMKRILTALAALTAMTTPVLASGGPDTTGTSMMAIIFLGFCALIIVGQLIPGLFLFCSALKGLFGKSANEISPGNG
jgi:hypothetical protein